MAPNAPIASERVFAKDANGISRLVAAPGDVIPEEVPTPGVVQTPPDPPHAAPIDGYDSLSEDEVVARLAELDAETLAAVRAYEQAHLARGSITRYGLESKVVDIPPEPSAKPATAPEPSTTDDEGSSSAQEPFQGYEETSAKDIVARLHDASPEEVAAVKAYEAHRSEPRKTIVEFEPAAE